jgi:DNA-binding LacI/PurR family transcriptional regulator
MSSAVLVQTKGWQRSFQPSMNASIAAMRSLTEVKVPRRMACRVRMPKKISTMFSHDPEVGVKCMRIRGFLASQAAGLERLAHIIPSGLTEAEGSRAAASLIDEREGDSATAAFVFNDQSAVGFLATVRASGIKVPQQLSVVGYDDSRLARACWARLTTIHQDSGAIARAAVERAIARIAGEPSGKPVLIKPTLIERATTAPPIPL